MSLLIDIGKLGSLGGAEGGSLGTGLAFIFSVANRYGTVFNPPNTVQNDTGVGFIVNATVLNADGTPITVTY